MATGGASDGGLAWVTRAMVTLAGSGNDVAFERHETRRAGGVPTVTVLVGDPEAAESCWIRWQRGRNTPVTCVAAAGLKAMLHGWLCGGAVRAALAGELRRRAASANGVSVEELCVRVAAHAQSQRDALAERLSRQVGWSSSLVLCALKDGEEELLGWVSADSSTALAELWAALPSGLPALLARAPENAGSGWFGEAASSLIQIAEAVPRAELAMAATEEDICSWQRGAQPRERSLLGEGLIQLEPGPGVAKHAPRVVSAQAFPALAAAPRLYYDEADLARSRAERTLYRELEGRPRTRGLFALNGRLAAPFGPAPLEVDLLSEALSIAVEIDGYHHFRDASAYRRDRDKDVLLQRLGYTVVRVLAIDVDAQLGYVLDTIDRVVDHEKQKRSR